MKTGKIYNRGFTLVELLVVMAVSMILMGLVLAPVVQTFSLTRRAQAMVDAQDAARVAIELISRELGQAMYVYDNANAPVDLPVAVPGTGPVFFPLEYAKIDLYLPRITMHCNNPEHPPVGPRDYPRGNEAWPPCPVCTDAGIKNDEVEARPKLPLEQDVTIVRYFLGLANNKLDTADNNGWVSPWESDTVTGQENQVVLYRAEFSLYDNTLFPEDMDVMQRLSDPRFFYRDGYAERWKAISRVIGIGKYEDLVIATRDDTGKIIALEPTITFRTVAIDNDTFAGAYSSDKTFEYPNAVPTLFYGAYGYWTPDHRVVVYRDDPDTEQQDPYELAYSTGMRGDHLVIYRWTQEGGGWVSKLEFDITDYLRTGEIRGLNPDGEPLAMAFTVDPNRGAVSFALRPKAPPGALSVSDLDPDAINRAYHDVYERDPASAMRYAILATFDSNRPDQYLPNARIVPGSEHVAGPDMTPGFEFTGRLVRYERVPLALGDPGLNQYKINYDTGEIYFSPSYEHNLPAFDAAGRPLGVRIRVDYDIQFNRSGDVVKGDYATKSLINIHLGMRMFDPESGQPHPVDLNKSVKVRNALR